MHHPFPLRQPRVILNVIVVALIVVTLTVSSHPPVVQAAGLVNLVTIIDGQVDADQLNGITATDDVAQVVLAFDDAAIIKVQISNGSVDVNANGVIAADDDLLNADLNKELPGNLRASDQVDIINGQVDVDENGAITTADDATDIILLR